MLYAPTSYDKAMKALKEASLDIEHALRVRIDLPGPEGDTFDSEFYVEDDESDYDIVTYLLREIEDTQRAYHGVYIEEEWNFGFLVVDWGSDGVVERRYIYIYTERR